MEDAQSPALCFDEFGVVLADGRGDDEGIGLAEVVGRMPDRDRGAQGPENVDDVGFLRVEPETVTPFMTMIRAIPDIPDPPMPMKWTAPSSPTGTMFAGLVFAEVMISLPARG